MRKILGLAAIAAALAVVGCIETRGNYVLNPDASGKVMMEILMPNLPMNFGDEEKGKADPNLLVKQFAKGVLDSAKGIDAWADVTIGQTEDGRMQFKGTAYFKDIAKRDVSAGASNEDITFTKDDKGGMVLLMKEQKAAKKPAEAGESKAPGAEKMPEPAAPAAEKLSDEEIANRIKAEREQYKQSRFMMEAFLAKMKVEITFRLPGTVAETSGFTKEPDGSVRFVLEGQKMLQAMDLLMADDAYVRGKVLSGKKSGGGPDEMMDDTMMEKMFGAKGPFRVRVTGDLKPQFDYAKEVAAAKEAYPKMIENLGLDKVPAGGPNIKIGPGEEPTEEKAPPPGKDQPEQPTPPAAPAGPPAAGK